MYSTLGICGLCTGSQEMLVLYESITIITQMIIYKMYFPGQGSDYCNREKRKPGKLQHEY